MTTTALTKEQTRAYAMIPEVKANHREHIKAGKEAIKYAMQAGELLNKMKPLVKHGEWEEIVERCGIEVRIAQLYMRLAKELPKLVSPEVMSEYTIRGGLKLIADQKKGGDQGQAKNETVSLLKSASNGQQSTSENGKHDAPPETVAEEPPVEPNECKGPEFDTAKLDAELAADEAAKPKTPDEIMAAVQAEYDQCLEYLKQARRVFNVLEKAERSGPWLIETRTRVVQHFEGIRDTLASIRPGGLCTKCKGAGCEFCHNTGHLTGHYVRSRSK